MHSTDKSHCRVVLQVLINVLIIFPWSCVLLLSWLVNKWQLMFRPVGAAFW
jgi:hypothetical protein